MNPKSTQYINKQSKEYLKSARGLNEAIDEGKSLKREILTKESIKMNPQKARATEETIQYRESLK